MKVQRYLPSLGTIAIYIVGLVTGVFISQVFNHTPSKDVQGAAYQRLVTQTAVQTQATKPSPILTPIPTQFEIQALIDNVGKLIALPQGEQPTIATVSDYTKLQDQLFFQNAKNGDKVLIYSKAKKAILFDPQENKIIEVGPSSDQTYINANPTIQPTPEQTSNTSTGLSNNNYHINSSGNSVHSSAYSTNDQVPAGATAKCADGMYSFSQSARGTCSHHGGVAQWL